MIRIALLALSVFCCVDSYAQPRKSSFFNKDGRTYEVGTQFYALGGDRAKPVALRLAFGREYTGKRFFYQSDFQLISSYNYSYQTRDYNDVDVKVSGRTSARLVYGLQFGHYLLRFENEKQVKPFVSLGGDVTIISSVKKEIDEPASGVSKRKQTVEEGTQVGLVGGAGCVIEINQDIGIRFFAGYNRQLKIKSTYGGEEKFYPFSHHPFINVGFRYILTSE